MLTIFFITIILTLLSKFASFTKEAMVAGKLGVSIEYDFYLEFTVIPLSVAAVITYAIFYAYTPYFQELKIRIGNKKAIDKLLILSTKWSFFVFTGLIFFAVLHLLATFGMDFFDFSYNTEQKWKVFCIITPVVLMVVLQCLISFFSIPLLANFKSIAVTISPIAGTVLAIFFMLFSDNFDAASLALMLFYSFLLSFIFLTFFLVRLRNTDNCKTQFKTAGVFERVLLSSLILIVIIESLPQLGNVVERLLMSHHFNFDGVLSVVAYSQTLIGFFTSFGVLVVVRLILPKFSQINSFNNLNRDETLFFYSFILFVFFMFLYAFFRAYEIVYLIFFSGAFSLEDVVYVSDFLKVLSPVIILDVLYAALAAKCYSAKRYGNLIRSSAIAFICRMFVLSFALFFEALYFIAISIVVFSSARVLFLLLYEYGRKSWILFRVWGEHLYLPCAVVFVYFLLFNGVWPDSSDKLALLFNEFMFALPVLILFFVFVRLKCNGK